MSSQLDLYTYKHDLTNPDDIKKVWELSDAILLKYADQIMTSKEFRSKCDYKIDAVLHRKFNATWNHGEFKYRRIREQVTNTEHIIEYDGVRVDQVWLRPMY